jgi:hypothetical protein
MANFRPLVLRAGVPSELLAGDVLELPDMSFPGTIAFDGYVAGSSTDGVSFTASMSGLRYGEVAARASGNEALLAVSLPPSGASPGDVFFELKANGSGNYTLKGDDTGALTWDSDAIWHAGNDGSGSGLDADLLDGVHVGTSGNTVPKCNTANTFSDTQTVAGTFVQSAAGSGPATIQYQLSNGDNVTNWNFNFPDLSTATCSIRYFRNTNTSGGGTFDIYAADGTSTMRHQFSSTGDAFVSNGAGNFGVGTNSPQGKLHNVGSEVQTGIQTANLTAATANFSLSATTRILRLTATGAQSLNGITGGTEGRRLTILNVDTADTITLTHDATSTAANRFYCPAGANLAVRRDGGVELVYDGTSSRWRVIAP